MILDDAKAKKKRCNIVVTQPRRIAARSIAERVANERGWDLGSLVGYQVIKNKYFFTQFHKFCAEQLFATTHFRHMINYVHFEVMPFKKRQIYTSVCMYNSRQIDFNFSIVSIIMLSMETN